MAVSNLDLCVWAYEGKFGLVMKAVDENAEYLAERDSNERTALHWACASGKADIVSFLTVKGAEVIV